MQQRYYDPGIGRLLSVDPMASDTTTGWNFNRYNYAANNPYKFTDPDGRNPFPQMLVRELNAGFEQAADSAKAKVDAAVPRVIEGTMGVFDIALGSAEVLAGVTLGTGGGPLTGGLATVAGAALAANGMVTVGDGLIAVKNALDGGDRPTIEHQVGAALAGETGAKVGDIAAAARTANGARTAILKVAEGATAKGAVKAAHESAGAAEALKRTTEPTN